MEMVFQNIWRENIIADSINNFAYFRDTNALSTLKNYSTNNDLETYWKNICSKWIEVAKRCQEIAVSLQKQLWCQLQRQNGVKKDLLCFFQFPNEEAQKVCSCFFDFLVFFIYIFILMSLDHWSFRACLYFSHKEQPKIMHEELVGKENMKTRV